MQASDVKVNTFLSGACGAHPHPDKPTFQLAWNATNAAAAAAQCSHMLFRGMWALVSVTFRSSLIPVKEPQSTAASCYLLSANCRLKGVLALQSW